MDVSRRFFIGGAASFTALTGCRMFSGLASGGKPNLVFGVLSDIHVLAEDVDRNHQGNTRVLKHAFRWFRDQGADAVVIAGDMADAGLISQLQAVGDAWEAVFPNDTAPDGRHVEKVFVYGNHDYEGFNYGYMIYGQPSGELRREFLRNIGLKKAWEEVFHEEYSPIYRKTVKGYDFIGGHWDPANGSRWGGGPDLEAWMKANGKSLDPKLPFFYAQHPHPKDTCYGPWAWGHDAGNTTRALTPFANAVAFSGHSHYTLLDERGFWQGAFTSVGTSSLRYNGQPYDEFAGTTGYENSGTRVFKPVMLANGQDASEAREGMLWRVYDDHAEVVRRNFNYDENLGPDWIMPLPAAESKPFAFEGRAAKAVAPEFAADAKAAVKKAEAKKTETKDGKKTETKIPYFDVTFPAALCTATTRVLNYKVDAETRDGKVVLSKRVLADDFYMPLSRVGRKGRVGFAFSELPQGQEVRFVVRPGECFGKLGKPLATEWVKVGA